MKPADAPSTPRLRASADLLVSPALFIVFASLFGCTQKTESGPASSAPDAVVNKSLSNNTDSAANAQGDPAQSDPAQADPANAQKPPHIELMEIVNDIHKNVPAGIGPAGDAMAKNYYLKSRDRLTEFSKKHEGRGESIMASVLRSTLSIAAGAQSEAIEELHSVLDKLGNAVDSKSETVRLEALTWLLQIEPARARKELQRIIEANNSFSRRATKLYRFADAVEFLKIGSEPPAFTGAALDGAPITKESLKGKTAVLLFWSSAIAPSLETVTAAKKLQKEFAGAGLEIVSICMDGKEVRSVPGGGEPCGEGADAVKRFAAEYKVPGKLVYDGRGYDGDLAESFAISSIPGVVVLDRAGVVRSLATPPSALYDVVKQAVESK